MDLETFRKLATDRRVIPVTRKLLADGDTPVALYRKLAAERPGTFLLESAENGRSWSRYSFVGVRSAATLTERDGRELAVQADRGVPVGQQLPADRDDTAVLRQLAEGVRIGGDGARGHGPQPSARARPLQDSGSSPASKQVRSPVWQAAPTWSTLTRIVSPSQSRATDFTCWTCPEVSPLTQYSRRLRLQ